MCLVFRQIFSFLNDLKRNLFGGGFYDYQTQKKHYRFKTDNAFFEWACSKVTSIV
jgi:hypothetical protein